ncbi:hypothetical protein JAAARDRAFT_41873 [Jaapia argillacea MUCL 33604]|uniref:Uncharacterized protein n=1 Tax=Jaapia argillacea MUCL 33604 TaxID=933084 RepID=A0A067PHX6_9AGAM|nr:hypothetical protein JAAARDRAFT_41873 [Jaapia argillacea MUCL 33604]
MKKPMMQIFSMNRDFNKTIDEPTNTKSPNSKRPHQNQQGSKFSQKSLQIAFQSLLLSHPAPHPPSQSSQLTSHLFSASSSASYPNCKTFFFPSTHWFGLLSFPSISFAPCLAISSSSSYL